MEEEVRPPEQPVKTAKPRSSPKKEETIGFRDLDPKRLFVGLAILIVIAGAVSMWAKDNFPRYLAQQDKITEEKAKEIGSVAGEADVNLDGLQTQVDEIKKDVIGIKVEDVKEQESVKKILRDLDELIKNASQSTKMFDVKGNLCEEAKKRFCE